ncbi:MAG: peptidyl-prolyl cis-trans isomerase [Bacteroidota bacterium]
MKFFLSFISLLLCACNNGLPDRDAGETEKKVVARVGSKQLYLTDLQGVLPANVSKEDSANLSRHYAETWVKKELMLEEAKSKAQLDNAEIERKVEDYRYSLTLYEFEKEYLQKKLDTLVPAAVLNQYYQDNVRNFVLKQNIVRATLVQMPKKNAQLNRVKMLVNSTDKKDAKELSSLCSRFAEQYYLDDAEWIDFEKLVSNTPWLSLPNKERFLQQNKQVEISNENTVFLLHIKQAKTTGQTAPLEFAEEQIRSLILNQRKVNLVNSLEKQVYERAKANKEFQIY